MTHTPERNKKKTYIFSAIVFTVLAVLFFLASIPVYNVGIWQLLSMFVFVISAFLLDKFYLSTYTYTFNGAEFYVVKNTGKKSVKVCHIDVDSITDFYTKGEWEKNKKTRQVNTVYNYNAEFLPREYAVVVFSLYKKVYAVVFQPSEEMTLEMKKVIPDMKENQ